MAQIPHDERVAEGDASTRKRRLVGEEGGLDLLDGEGAHLPAVGVKSKTVEAAAIAGHPVVSLVPRSTIGYRLPCLRHGGGGAGDSGGVLGDLLTLGFGCEIKRAFQ